MFILHNNRRLKFQTSAAVIKGLLSFWVLDSSLLKVEVVEFAEIWTKLTEDVIENRNPVCLIKAETLR